MLPFLRTYPWQILKTFIFIGLALLTLQIATHTPRHQPTGEQLLRNPTFSNHLEDWQFSEANRPQIATQPDGTVTLRAADATQHVSLVQTVEGLRNNEPLLLTGELQCDAVEIGAKSWYLARLVLARYDGQGRWLSLPHYVAALSGSQDWQSYATVFQPDERTARTQVRLELPYASGTLRARNLSLRVAEINPLYRPLQWVVFAAWGGFLVWWLLPYLQKARGFFSRLAVLLVAITLLSGILLPGAQRQQFKDDVKQVAVALEQQITPADTKILDESENFYDVLKDAKRHLPFEWEKVAHFVLFAVLAVTLGLAVSSRPKWMLLVDLAMLAVATELLQLFIEGRSALLGDVGLDLAGVVAGLLVVVAWNRIKGKWAQVP